MTLEPNVENNQDIFLDILKYFIWSIQGYYDGLCIISSLPVLVRVCSQGVQKMKCMKKKRFCEKDNSF